jgi:hypothetical protein
MGYAVQRMSSFFARRAKSLSLVARGENGKLETRSWKLEGEGGAAHGGGRARYIVPPHNEQGTGAKRPAT